ncbi:MAG: hypothetical protein FWH25_03115 [Syntrophorhabdaceae bacterium]|nr:hypothetical protein [Syntrophorhabdaceae bacterium]
MAGNMFSKIWKILSGSRKSLSEDGSDMVRDNPKPSYWTGCCHAPYELSAKYRAKMGDLGLKPESLANARTAWMSLDTARSEELRLALGGAQSPGAAKALRIAFRQAAYHYQRTRGAGASATCYDMTRDESLLHDARGHLLTRMEFLAEVGRKGGVKEETFNAVAGQIACALAVFGAAGEKGMLDKKLLDEDLRSCAGLSGERSGTQELGLASGDCWWIVVPTRDEEVAAASLGGMALKAPIGWARPAPGSRPIAQDESTHPGKYDEPENWTAPEEYQPSPPPGPKRIALLFQEVLQAGKIDELLDKVETEWGVAFSDEARKPYRKGYIVETAASEGYMETVIDEYVFVYSIYEMIARAGKWPPPWPGETEEDIYAALIERARTSLVLTLNPMATPEDFGPETKLNELAPFHSRYKVFKRLSRVVGPDFSRIPNVGYYLLLAFLLVLAVMSELSLRFLYAFPFSLIGAIVVVGLAYVLLGETFTGRINSLFVRSKFTTLGDYVREATRGREEGYRRKRFSARIRELLLSCLNENDHVPPPPDARRTDTGSVCGDRMAAIDDAACFTGPHNSNVVPYGRCPVCRNTVGFGSTQCPGCGYHP